MEIPKSLTKMLKSIIDQKYIRIVNKLARTSAEKGFDPFRAILVFDNQINASSMDKCIEYSDPTAHAELILISEFCRSNKLISLENYTLYCNVEPCVMCSGAIHWARISRIVFGVSQQMLQSISGGKSKPNCDPLINIGNKKIEVVGPVLPNESIELLKSFPFITKKKRHQEYYFSQ